MSTEENKALIRRVTEEVYSQGKIDAVDRYYAPDWVLHDAPPNAGGDRQALKDVLRATSQRPSAEGGSVASSTHARS